MGNGDEGESGWGGGRSRLGWGVFLRKDGLGLEGLGGGWGVVVVTIIEMFQY